MLAHGNEMQKLQMDGDQGTHLLQKDTPGVHIHEHTHKHV